MLHPTHKYRRTCRVKVAVATKSKKYISFILRDVLDLGLQIPELKILFQSDIRLRRYFMLKWLPANNSGNNFLFILIVF